MKWAFYLLLAASAAPGQQALYLDLSGEWRQHHGDQPAYAQPGFDDRGWTVVRLPWQQQSEATLFWLRRTVNLPEWAARMPLALTLGPVSPVYEVYVNGVRIAQTGPFFDDGAVYPARSRTHPIPPAAVAGRSRLTVAVRARSYDFATRTLTIFRGGTYALTDVRSARGHRDFDVLARQRILFAPAMAGRKSTFEWFDGFGDDREADRISALEWIAKERCSGYLLSFQVRHTRDAAAWKLASWTALLDRCFPSEAEPDVESSVRFLPEYLGPIAIQN